MNELMTPDALRRRNYYFFNNDLPLRCLRSRDFDYEVRSSFSRSWVGAYTQFPFVCSDKTTAYLCFRNEECRDLLGTNIDGAKIAESSLFNPLAEDLQKGFRNLLIGGLQISFVIVWYEAMLGGALVQIKDPIIECPSADTPLNRILDMRICEHSHA